MRNLFILTRTNLSRFLNHLVITNEHSRIFLIAREALKYLVFIALIVFILLDLIGVVDESLAVTDWPLLSSYLTRLSSPLLDN